MQDSAFIELFEQQYPRVVAYARRRLGSMPDAEDCAAEVFRLAWEQDSLPSVGWLFVTARNIVYAANRSHQRLSQLCFRIAVEEGTEVTGEDLGVLEAMDSLSDTDREILMAYYWDDLSGAQCATVMGCSTAAVWVRLHRARQGLKAVLEKQGIRGSVRPVVGEPRSLVPGDTQPSSRDTRSASRDTRPSSRDTRSSSRDTQPSSRDTRPSSRESLSLSSCRRQDLVLDPACQGETS